MGRKIIGCASSNSNNPDQRRPREKSQKGTGGENRSNRCEKRVYPHDRGQVGEKGEIFLLQFANAKRKLGLGTLG